MDDGNSYFKPHHLPHAKRPAFEIVEALAPIKIITADGTVCCSIPAGTRGIRPNNGTASCLNEEPPIIFHGLQTKVWAAPPAHDHGVSFTIPQHELYLLRVVPPAEHSPLERPATFTGISGYETAKFELIKRLLEIPVEKPCFGYQTETVTMACAA